MATDPISLVGLLLSAVRTVPAIKGATKALVSIPELARASKSTETEYPAAENLLEVWTKSAHFSGVVEMALDGRRDADDDALIASFTAATGFDAGSQTREQARQIVEAFLRHLADAHYSGPQAIPVLAKRIETQHSESKSLFAALDAGLRQVTARLDSSAPTAGSTGLEQSYHATVDAARDLLQQGKPRTARQLLNKLLGQLQASSVSAWLSFRIVTNLGSAALMLDELDIAAREFERALTLQPESVKALTNCAQIAILRGRLPEAEELVDRARLLDPRDTNAVALKIEVLQRAKRWGDLKSLEAAELWIRDNVVCLLALANARYKEERFADSEGLTRRALAIEPDDVHAHDLLGQSIAFPLLASLRGEPSLDLAPSDRDRLLEAERAFSGAVEGMAENEGKSELVVALVNRAAIRLALHNLDGALSDCQRVLGLDPTNTEALRNKGLILVNLDREADAISCFEELWRIRREPAIAVDLAHCYLETGRADRATEMLRDVWANVEGGRSPMVGYMLLRSYAAASRKNEALAFAEELRSLFPTETMSLIAIAKFYDGEGREADALKALEAALDAARGREKTLVAFEVGTFHYSHGRFQEAADAFEQAGEMRRDNPGLKRYLIALFNAGRLHEALAIARRVRSTGPALPVITEVEARVLEEVGELDEALELRKQLASIDPDNLEHSLRAAQLYIRQNNLEAARELVEKAAPKRESNDWNVLVNLARLRAMLGMDGVLDLAYEARRQGFDKPEAHMTYVGLFLSREKLGEELKAPEAIGVHSTVHLKSTDERRIFTIIESTTKPLRQEEIKANGDLAKRLIGAKKGQTIRLTAGHIEDVEYEILDVQSKYVHAFQETLTGFATWFPEENSLQRMTVKDNDFVRLFSVLDARNAVVGQLTAAYKAVRLGLGAVAHLAGVSEIDVWASMASSNEGAVLAGSGSADDNQAESDAVAQSNGLILDLSAILTVDYLGIGDVLSKGFDRLCVAQSVLDHLQEQILREEIGPSTAGTLGKHGEHYTRSEITPEQQAAHLAKLRGLRDFVLNKTTVVSMPAALDFRRSEIEDFEQALGESGFGSVLAARSLKLPLFADDLFLRRFAKVTWSVNGVWSQQVLLDLRRRGQLDEPTYHRLVVQLAVANYAFLSIDARGLLQLLRDEEFKLNPRVTRVFQLLKGPDCDEDSAIRVGLDLLRLVWLEGGLLQHQRHLVLDLLLSGLFAGRPRRRVLSKLKAGLPSRFPLAPQYAIEILRLLELVERIRPKGA
jgi:tetratricopeptide (TPR) repeat protein